MTSPAYTLLPGQTAGIIKRPGPDVGVSGLDYSVASADPTIAAIVDTGDNHPGVAYVGDGDVEITVTQLSDLSERVHSVHCGAPVEPPEDWDWELGTAV